MISGLIQGVDCRSDRMDKDDIEYLTKLDDTAPEHQGQQWNKENVSNHDLKPKTTNFQYIYGYYAIFDYDLSGTSPYSDVEECYKTQGSKHHQKSLLYHPHKNQDKTAEEKLVLLKSIRKHKKLWKK